MAMRIKLILGLAFLLLLPLARAAAPVCLYQDVLSGPVTGGEGGNGIYLSIYGTNFGSATPTASQITINGTAVAQVIYFGADPTGNRQQLGVQVASGTTSGPIVFTNSGGSCSNLSFAVRSGNIWFIGPGADHATLSSPTCTQLKNQTVSGDTGNGGQGTYANPWLLTDQAVSSSGNAYSTTRTPYTYLYYCGTAGDVFVFLNGVNYQTWDGYALNASIVVNKSTSSSAFYTYMTRPGATARFGIEGGPRYGLSDSSAGYNVFSGLTLTGSSGTSGTALNLSAWARAVGIDASCPSCDGPAAAVHNLTYPAGAAEILGNNIHDISNDTAIIPVGSNKEYHAIYYGDSTTGNLQGTEIAWNKISRTSVFNGIQINHDGSAGFYNFSIHDNDLADVNGSGINLAQTDPASGYVRIYNNIIHHTGVKSPDGGFEAHGCLAIKPSTASGVGVDQIYNNTMFDCNAASGTISYGYSCAIYFPLTDYSISQSNVTVNLVNNIVYAPVEADQGSTDYILCTSGSAVGTTTGSNNIFYLASGGTTVASPYALAGNHNPNFISATDGVWTNYKLQSTSPAILAGSASLYPTLDFAGYTFSNPPAIGALMYQGGGSSSNAGMSGNVRMSGNAGIQ